MFINTLEETNMTKAEAKQPDKYKRYEDSQKAKGLQKIHPWVPVEDVERAMKYCARLRKAHAKSQA